jgi:ABC-type Na+ transport system ATPase subunit NatA
MRALTGQLGFTRAVPWARLTVREGLRVFGRLYGVPNVGVRVDELADEFDLGTFLTGTWSAFRRTEDPRFGGHVADQSAGSPSV